MTTSEAASPSASGDLRGPRPADPQTVAALLLVALTTGLAYSNSWLVPFQFDDGNNIVENPAARSVGAFLSARSSPRRWLTHLTFALNGSLGGSVAGFHTVNLALHLATALEVFFLTRLALRLLWNGQPERIQRSAVLGPLAAALVFALHPLQTQAVTYIVQRLTGLAAFLVVGAVLLHGLGVSATRARHARAFHLGALAAAMASLFAKENAVAVPLAVAAFDLAFCPGAPRDRLRRLAPHFVLTAAVALLVLRPAAIVRTVTHDYAGTYGADALPPWLSYLLTQPRVILTYLRLLVLPVGQTLDYDFPVVSAVLARSTLLPIAGLGALLGVPGALAWRHRTAPAGRAVLFALAWLLVTLAVESSVIPLPDVINEHRMYLPLAGIAVALGVCASLRLEQAEAAPSRLTLPFAFLLALAIALGSATWARNRAWSDPDTLWSDVVAKAPGKARGYIWLAQARAGRGDLAGAIRLLETAANLPRTLPEVFVSLGSFRAAAGLPTEAEVAYRRALSLPGGELAEAHLGLAQLLFERQDVEGACLHFQAASALAPASTLARTNLAACKFRRGDVEGAIADWQRVLREEPSNAAAAANLANALAGGARAGTAP